MRTLSNCKIVKEVKIFIDESKIQTANSAGEFKILLINLYAKQQILTRLPMKLLWQGSRQMSELELRIRSVKLPKSTSWCHSDVRGNAFGRPHFRQPLECSANDILITYLKNKSNKDDSIAVKKFPLFTKNSLKLVLTRLKIPYSTWLRYRSA